MDAQQSRREVRAAGAVVLRRRDEHTEVLVVHRPRYDDWSLPKGKLDGGESFEQAAVREVHEETGVSIVLRQELDATHYTDRKGRPKVVRWWLADFDGDTVREPDAEVDAVRWIPIEDAPSVLSYDADLGLLSQALAAQA